MICVNEHYGQFGDGDDYFWIFDRNINDINLVLETATEDFVENAYEVDYGGINKVVIPESWHIVICDIYYDKIDSIRPGDLLSNEFEAPVWINEFNRVKSVPVRADRYIRDAEFKGVPFIRDCIFLWLREGEFVLVSRSDLSNHLDLLSFYDAFGG